MDSYCDNNSSDKLVFSVCELQESCYKCNTITHFRIGNAVTEDTGCNVFIVSGNGEYGVKPILEVREKI